MSEQLEMFSSMLIHLRDIYLHVKMAETVYAAVESFHLENQANAFEFCLETTAVLAFVCDCEHVRAFDACQLENLL